MEEWADDKKQTKGKGSEWNMQKRKTKTRRKAEKRRAKRIKVIIRSKNYDNKRREGIIKEK